MVWKEEQLGASRRAWNQNDYERKHTQRLCSKLSRTHGHKKTTAQSSHDHHSKERKQRRGSYYHHSTQRQPSRDSHRKQPGQNLHGPTAQLHGTALRATFQLGKLSQRNDLCRSRACLTNMKSSEYRIELLRSVSVIDVAPGQRLTQLAGICRLLLVRKPPALFLSRKVGCAPRP